MLAGWQDAGGGGARLAEGYGWRRRRVGRLLPLPLLLPLLPLPLLPPLPPLLPAAPTEWRQAASRTPQAAHTSASSAPRSPDTTYPDPDH